MPFFLLAIPALIGGGLVIASNAADNLTEKQPKVTEPIGGGVLPSLPSYITIPLIVGGTVILIKLGSKFLKKI